MPLFPYILTKVVPDGAGVDDAFERGKRAGIVVGLAALAVYGAVLRRSLGALAGTVTTVVAAFGLVMLKAPWAQADLLYYFLFALTAWLMFRLLQSPNIPTAVATGLAVGCTQLTKPSAIPLFALFALAACAWIVAQRDQTVGQRLKMTSVIASVGFIALLTILPYASNSNDIFGAPFFNVNSSYYLWYDSWPDVLAGTSAYGDQFGPPALPPSRIPTASDFLDHHSWGQIGTRVVEGLITEARLLAAWPVSWFVAAQTIAAAGALWTERARVGRVLRRDPIPYLFAAAVVMTYLVLSEWWMPITPAARFPMVLVLPVLTGSGWVVHALWTERIVAIGGIRTTAANLYFGAVAALTLVVLVPLSVVQAGSMYGGH